MVKQENNSEKKSPNLTFEVPLVCVNQHRTSITILAPNAIEAADAVPFELIDRNQNCQQCGRLLGVDLPEFRKKYPGWFQK